MVHTGRGTVQAGISLRFGLQILMEEFPIQVVSVGAGLRSAIFAPAPKS